MSWGLWAFGQLWTDEGGGLKISILDGLSLWMPPYHDWFYQEFFQPSERRTANFAWAWTLNLHDLPEADQKMGQNQYIAGCDLGFRINFTYRERWSWDMRHATFRPSDPVNFQFLPENNLDHFPPGNNEKAGIWWNLTMAGDAELLTGNPLA